METAHYHDRVRVYRQNKSSIAALLLGRCSSSMTSQLHSRTDWEQIEKDPVPLLEAIREHSLNYDSTKYRMKIILDALKNMVNLRQNHGEDLEVYLLRHKAAKKVFLSHVGKEFTFELLTHKDPEYSAALRRMKDAILAKDTTAAKKAEKELSDIKKNIQDEFFTYMYMAHADQSKYGTFMAGLDTKYSLLKDKSQHEYPVDMVSAHNAIGNHRWDPGYKRHKDKDRKSVV